MAIDWPDDSKEFALSLKKDGISQDVILERLRHEKNVNISSRTTLWKYFRKWDKEAKGEIVPSPASTAVPNGSNIQTPSSAISPYPIPTPPYESPAHFPQYDVALRRPSSDSAFLKADQQTSVAITQHASEPSFPLTYTPNSAFDFSFNDYWGSGLIDLYATGQNSIGPPFTPQKPPQHLVKPPNNLQDTLVRHQGSWQLQNDAVNISNPFRQKPSPGICLSNTPSTPTNQGTTPDELKPNTISPKDAILEFENDSGEPFHRKPLAEKSAPFSARSQPSSSGSMTVSQPNHGVYTNLPESTPSKVSPGGAPPSSYPWDRDSGYYSFRSSTGTILSEYCDELQLNIPQSHQLENSNSIVGNAFVPAATGPDRTAGVDALHTQYTGATTSVPHLATPISRPDSSPGLQTFFEDDKSKFTYQEQTGAVNATRSLANYASNFKPTSAPHPNSNPASNPLHRPENIQQDRIGSSSVKGPLIQHSQNYHQIPRKMAVGLHRRRKEYQCNHEDHMNFLKVSECPGCGFSKLHYHANKPFLHGISGPGSLPSELFLHSQRLRPDRFNNSPMHYFAASAPQSNGCLQTFMALHEHGAKFEEPNNFGETPLHVLDPSNLSGDDLYQILAYVIACNSQQFLAQSRDIQGRTIFHCLSEHVLTADHVENLFKCFDVADKKNAHPGIQNIINSRDNAGRTPAGNIERNSKSEYTAAVMSMPEQSGFGGPKTIQEAKLKRQRISNFLVARHACLAEYCGLPTAAEMDSAMDQKSKEQMLQFLEYVDKQFISRFLEEDGNGRTILHCLSYVDLDAATRLSNLKRALNARVYIPESNARIGVDVNTFDKLGLTPLHAAIEGTWKRNQGPKLAEQIEKEMEIMSLNWDHSSLLNDFLAAIPFFGSNNSSPLVNLIVELIKEWNMNPLTETIDTFLKKVREHDRIRHNQQLAYMDELLLKSGVPGPKKQSSFCSGSSPRSKSTRTKRFSEQIRTESENIVEEYKRNGADINLKDRFGRSPLLLACVRGLPDFVRALLKNGANVNSRDAQGAGVIASAALAKSKGNGETDRAAIEECIFLVRRAGGVESPTAQDEFFAWCKTCHAHRHRCVHKLLPLQ